MRFVEVPVADEIRWLGKQEGWTQERVQQELAKIQDVEEQAQRWQDMRSEMQDTPNASAVQAEVPDVPADAEASDSSSPSNEVAAQIKQQIMSMSHQLGEASKAIRDTLASLDQKLDHIAEQRLRINSLKKELGIV